MAKFTLVASRFERSSGCRLHRDLATGKCQVLPLGRWKGTLQQEDIPHQYMKLTGSLAMVRWSVRPDSSPRHTTTHLFPV